MNEVMNIKRKHQGIEDDLVFQSIIESPEQEKARQAMRRAAARRVSRPKKIRRVYRNWVITASILSFVASVSAAYAMIIHMM